MIIFYTIHVAHSAVSRKKIRMKTEALQQCANYYNNCLAKLADVPQTSGCNPTPMSKKKEKDMQNVSFNPTIRVDTPRSETFNAVETAQKHLSDRLDAAIETHIEAAKKAFGLVGDDRPRTPQSIVDRILAGRFVIPEDLKNSYVYDPAEYIVWRDPSVKKDEAGFDVAQKKIYGESSDIMDIIIVKGNEAGLEAVNAFKAKTFH